LVLKPPKIHTEATQKADATNVMWFSVAGSLVFSSVQHSDARMYKCDAYNFVVRQTSGGSYHRIVVQEGDSLKVLL